MSFVESAKPMEKNESTLSFDSEKMEALGF